MDLVSLIDIRKIALGNRSNVVKNLEEYERLNFSFSSKRADESFASSRNDSSATVSETAEIYEEENEDDDEPIEALIRGKVNFAI